MPDQPQQPQAQPQQGMNVDEDQFFNKYKPTQTEDEFFNKYDNGRVQDTHNFWFGKGPFDGKGSDYFFQQTPTGRILSAFGQGAKDSWGQGDGTALGAEIKWEAEQKKEDQGLVYGFHTSVMRPAAAAIDALSHSVFSLGAGVANVVGQTGEELSAAAKQEQEDFAEKFPNHPELARTAAKILGAPFGAAGELLKGAASGAGLEGGLEGPKGTADHVQVLQDARSKGVVGEGEAGYFKTVEPTPENIQARKEAAVMSGEPYGPVTREEFLGPKLVPNQTEIARQIDPDLFKELDRLQTEQDNLRTSRDYTTSKILPKEEITDRNTYLEQEKLQKSLQDIPERLQKVDEQLRDIIPDIADAKTRAQGLLESDTPEGHAFRNYIQAQAFEKAIALQEAKPRVVNAYRDAADIIPVPEGKTDASSTNSGKSSAFAPKTPSAAEQIISVLPEYRGGLKDLGKDKTLSRKLKGLPPVPEDSVRFYHGAKGGKPDTGGGRWVTTDPRYARDFRRGDKDNEVYYVDISKGHPSEVAARAWDEIDEQAGTNSVGTYHHLEIPEELAKQLKPIEDESTGDHQGGLKDVKGGELKESGLNKNIMIDAVQKGFDAKFQDTPLYHSITHADQAQKAFDYLEGNEKAAMEVAMGDREPPTGIHPEAILMALKEKAEAEGDTDTIQSLSQTRLGREASVMGQRLGLLRNLRENIDPTEILRGIQELWQDKGSKKITKTIEDIQDTIQKNMTDLHAQIGDFLKSIECDY